MDKNEILEELRKYSQIAQEDTEPQEDDLTYADIMSAYNIGHSTAQRLVAKLVEEGKLTKHTVRRDGYRQVVFRYVG